MLKVKDNKDFAASPSDSLEELAAASETVGALLARTRRDLGQDLRSVAETLRIRYAHLDAIENERYGELPGATYAIGFVRSYADYLRLDSASVVARFKAEVAGLDKATDLVFPVPTAEARIPGGALVILSLVLVALAYGGWSLLSSKDFELADLIPAMPEMLRGITADTTVPADTTTAADLAASAISDALVIAGGTPVRVPAQKSETATPAAGGQRATLTPEAAVSGAANSGVAAVNPVSPVRPSADPATTVQSATTEPAATEPSTTNLAASAPADTASSLPSSPESSVPPSTSSVLGAEGDVVLDEAPELSDFAEASGTGGPAADARVDAVPVEPDTQAIVSGKSPALLTTSASDALAAEELRPAGQPTTNAPTANTPATNAPTANTPAPIASPASSGAVVSILPAPGPAASAAASLETAVPSDASTEEAPTPDPVEIQTSAIPAAPGAAPPAEIQAIPGATARGKDGTGRVYGATDGESRIVVQAVADSWVQVRNASDDLLLTQVLQEGDSYRVPNRAGLRLLTGNAGGLQIFVDGRLVPELGPNGAVRRNVPLDPERLIAGTAVN